MKAKLISGALLAILLQVTGCSSFHREWREAGRASDATKPYLGNWEGKWVSNQNGHSGKLRCVLAEQPGADRFRAHFRATYAKVLRFAYVAELTGAVTNGVVHFTGESDLGKLAGGVYKYAGEADGTRFECTYESKYDHGTFQMSRAK